MLELHSMLRNNDSTLFRAFRAFRGQCLTSVNNMVLSIFIAQIIYPADGDFIAGVAGNNTLP
jgi:hypothetical protein